jgi:predicted permease
VFVGAEVALSLVLLVGAGLLVRSMTEVLTVDRGFQTDHRLVAAVTIPPAYRPERVAQTMHDLLERIAAMPEVISVASVSGQPLGRGSTGLGLAAADQPDTPGAPVPWAQWRRVTKDYFATMGVPLLMGRLFTDTEETGKPWRAVISKRAADLLWPGQNPIGRTAILWKGQGDTHAEVIGVVGNMRERGLENDPTLAVYFPEGPTNFLQLVVHTRAEPSAVIPSLRAAVTAVDRTLPVSNARSLDDVVTSSVATRRFTMWLLAAFAVLAFVLALAGVYGVLAYAVARRTGEIGVRLALGAEHSRVLGLVVVQGMRPALAGLGAGLVGALLASKSMTSLLFGVKWHDAETYAIAGTAMLVTTVVACYLPARQVLGVDPAISLRVE